MYYQVIDDTLWIGDTNWSGASYVESAGSITNNSIINIKCKNPLIKYSNYTFNSTSCINCEIVCGKCCALTINCPALSNLNLGDYFNGDITIKSSTIKEINFPLIGERYDNQIKLYGCSELTTINGLNGLVSLSFNNCPKLVNCDFSNCIIMTGINMTNGFVNCGFTNLNFNLSDRYEQTFNIRGCNHLETITLNCYYSNSRYSYSAVSALSISDCPELTTLYSSYHTGINPSNYTNCPKLTNIITDGSVEGRDSYTVKLNCAMNFYTSDIEFPYTNWFVDNGLYTVADGTSFHIKGERCLYCDMAGALIVDSHGVMNYKQGNDIRFPVNDNLTVYIIPTDDDVNLNAVIKAVANPQ